MPKPRKPKRDADGLFKTHCLTCGATLYNATIAEPPPNCDQCPGHDDIARRDQEAADQPERAPYGKEGSGFNPFAISRYTRPQFDYSHLRSPNYDKNSARLKGDEYPCIICGRPVPNPKYMVWEHCGGGTVVTHAEGERLNAAGREGGDLGGQPIGADCLRKHPELKPYVNEE